MISTRNAKNIIPRNNRNPWSWIPTLYFAEGLPYVAVMTIAVIMYKRLGLSNTEIALYTSWLYLPWTIKPLWSPFVDLVKTKRSWIIAMQGLIGRYCLFYPDSTLCATHSGILLADGIQFCHA